ncbi:MAG: hypothetical protein CMC33_01140 [Flavobacteriaceae bacterium]|nr:hypothetical protein [Flavobacteriaceae bacterium]
MRKEKILIIGGTGFIGHHTLKKLQKLNFELYSVSTKYPRKSRKVKKVKYIICDISRKKLLDKKLNKGFSYIINFGGYVDHKNKAKTMASHYNGCKNLVDFFKYKKIKHFIQIGSSLEYGSSITPNKENNSCKPRGNYGLSKYKASQYLKKIGKKYNFPFTILRLYQIYGTNQSVNRLIPITIKACLKNKSFPCTNGLQRRDFLYIDDLIRLLILILRKKASNKIFNVGSGKPIKIKKIIKIINTKVGLGKPLFGKIKMRKDEIKNSFPSISRIKNQYKWIPKVSFEKGIKNTIFFYEKYGK